ncbi:MFS transporter [Candidatus Litorirhabdus singularis]|uniref:MFS transporter n=1 Tax=Candidatus Litorirhabdus singularis TaxID=2518993 RepID=UPI00242D805B|nr:MFS transporter [Candidatus Litorirhabdus singularis]
MLPYWRLSGFYFFYFALLGAYVPYWSLFLEGEGFSPLEIGYLSGAVMATKIMAPNLWGWLADASGKRLRVVQLGALLALLCFCGIFASREFSTLLLVVLLYSFFWNAILPQFEVITLAHLGAEYNRYSQLRVWGSVGFIVAVVGLGAWFDRVSVASLPWVMAGLLATIWLSSLLIVDVARPPRAANNAGLRQILRKKTVWGFLLVCFLLQVAHGPYYTFFSLHLEGLGYSRAAIGQLWALGVVAEVVLFLFMHRVLPRFGIRLLTLACLALAVLRWILIGYGAQYWLLLVLAQCLHAATFGAFHAVAIELIRRSFPPALAGQGQALYSGLSFGAGGAVGAIASGWLWQYSQQATYLMASGASLLALIIAWKYIHIEEASDEVTPAS